MSRRKSQTTRRTFLAVVGVTVSGCLDSGDSTQETDRDGGNDETDPRTHTDENDTGDESGYSLRASPVTANDRETGLLTEDDAVVERAPCDLALVTVRGETVGQPVALAGPGPHAPVAARRAAEFATVDDTEPVLLNVQEPGEGARERGEAAVADVAEAAGLEPEQYRSRVVLADDVEAGILDAVTDYDTVCVGATGTSAFRQVLFGSIPETIGKDSLSTVAMVRGQQNVPRSLAQAVRQRLS
jgi:nucleotide-binding universal stress UspA family protein